MDYRSKSYGEGRSELVVYGTNIPPSASMHDLRCYSASYAVPADQLPQPPCKELKFKPAKSGAGSSKKGWSLSDPELQRKKRVAGYKVYAVEGKMKGSLRKSFRWLKDRYTQVVYGHW